MEFAFETTRAIVNLLVSGALSRYSTLRFICSHGGGATPFLARRVTGSAPVMDANARIDCKVERSRFLGEHTIATIYKSVDSGGRWSLTRVDELGEIVPFMRGCAFNEERDPQRR